MSSNKIQKIYNGNRRNVGYKFAVWNCGRGLLQEGFSIKLSEIKQLISKYKPHSFGIIESDLYSTKSSKSRKTFTQAEIRDNLKIDGYKIEFPKTWEKHGEARIICYVSDEIKYSRKWLQDGNDHIPSITLEVGLGKATRTTVHYFYREWKNGVTGEDDRTSQQVQLKQHINQWEQIVRGGRQFVALGDANVCAMSWNDPSYRHKDLAVEIQSFLLQESCAQLVNKYTRIQSNAGTIQRSCLDHVIKPTKDGETE